MLYNELSKLLINRAFIMDKIQKFCLGAFLTLCLIAAYATDNGVPKCNTVFGSHLNASLEECK